MQVQEHALHFSQRQGSYLDFGKLLWIFFMYSKHIHELRNKGVTKKLGGEEFVALPNCLNLL